MSNEISKETAGKNTEQSNRLFLAGSCPARPNACPLICGCIRSSLRHCEVFPLLLLLNALGRLEMSHVIDGKRLDCAQVHHGAFKIIV